MNKIKLLAFTGILTSSAFLTGCSDSGRDHEVVYTKQSGEKTRDISELDGPVSYQVVGGRPVPPKAKQLHEQARARGEARDYDGAIKLLNQAIAEAPEWAYPHYDLAFTYLLKGEHEKALEKYRQVDALEPRGFFTTKTAVWTLEREHDDRFPKGTYLAYVSLEWADGANKSNLVERMAARLPSFPPIWKEMANLTEDGQRRKEYLDKALAMDADSETRGMLVLNKAAWLHGNGKKDESRAMLENILTNETSTVATVALAKQILKTFGK